MLMLKRRIKLAIPLLTAALTGCMVGPNFHQPAPPKVTQYTNARLPTKTVGSSYSKDNASRPQQFITAGDIPSEWWTLFRSEELNQLIKAGIDNSPTLAASKATLRQAQESLNTQVGNLLFPAFTAGLGGQRERQASASFAGDLPSTVFNLFNADISVSYLLDIFGGSRRQIESLMAQVDYQQFQLMAAYLTLTSNIATTAITTASLEDQIHATRQLIKEQEDQLLIMRKQFKLGGIPINTVLTQQTLVNQNRAKLPVLELQLAQAKHTLAILVGEFPDHRLPRIRLNKLILPDKIPVSLPSDLVRQRPDVRASEALLHAASAQIGVATANLFPQFNITGNFGYVSDTASNLFQINNRLWSFGGQLTQPIFKGGALFSQRRAAIAAYDQSAAQYQQTLLQAFKNVADSLRAIELDAEAYRAEYAAEDSARSSMVLARLQYRDGGASYLDLLTAQLQYQQTRIVRIRAQAARYTDTVALFQALGGGWWNRRFICGKDPVNPTNVSITCPS